MGARMSTETFWRHLQVKQLYSWIKSLLLRGEMVCLSHTLWSGRPLTRRMRARFPSDDGTLSPDSSRSDSSSLTDRRQGQQGFPRCDSLPFTSMLSPRFTLNLPMNRYASDGRRTRVQLHNLCASAVVVSRILGESACVMVLVSSPDTTSYSRVNKSPVWRRQRTRNKIERNCCSTPRREPRLLMTPHTRWESLQIRVKHTISQVSLESPTESWELRLGRQHAEMCW